MVNVKENNMHCRLFNFLHLLFMSTLSGNAHFSNNLELDLYCTQVKHVI